MSFSIPNTPGINISDPLLLQRQASTTAVGFTKPKSGSIVNWEPVIDRAAHINHPLIDEQEIERHRAVYYIGFNGMPGFNGPTGLGGEPQRRKRSRKRRSSAAGHHHASHHGDRKAEDDYDNIGKHFPPRPGSGFSLGPALIFGPDLTISAR